VSADRPKTEEHGRLDEARAAAEGTGGAKWRRWGTYLSERQWGTVREDYSDSGDAWLSFPYDQSRSRVYRWGEDGILGLSDNRGTFNVAVTLWNGKDSHLKERFFGLSGPEGNHGEDVKELFYYLDATPTCSYARALYKYPHGPFPYEELRAMARARGRDGTTPHLLETGVFDGGTYFDVQVEYAKAAADDVLVRITVTNQGPEERSIVVMPTFWFRNTWAWTKESSSKTAAALEKRPEIRAVAPIDGIAAMLATEPHLGPMTIACEGDVELVFTENETNNHLLYGAPNRTAFTKDAFHAYVVEGRKAAVNPARAGTKAAAIHRVTLAPGESRVFRARLTQRDRQTPGFAGFDAVFDARRREADAFYDAAMPEGLSGEERSLFRSAIAGLLWCRQYYNFDVDRWLRGDPAMPVPPAARKHGRNREWRHLFNSEVLSMPDKWEYPWYAAWDLAFHCIPMALVDPDFAKQQLSLLLREWYMHPNGQLPAYEWAFGDVNPPVHAWAALRVYQIDRRINGRADRHFLESVFHKLMLNFTWWVNRKDAQGNNVFQGGFLGLDNIGVFDRSNALPAGGELEQADATSWMGMYCLNLLSIALELAVENPSYQDVANKFFEHFLLIANAMTEGSDGQAPLWDEADGFFYDVLHLPGQGAVPMKVRSMVGLIPLFAVECVESSVLENFPAFLKRALWFIGNRPELSASASSIETRGQRARRLMAILDRDKLARLLAKMLDETEFLSPYGVRALSRVHIEQPYEIDLGGMRHRVAYEPGESSTGLFGGNSNWRGPVWIPVNYLIIESLQKYHHFYGDDFRVECPTGSGVYMNLWEVASELSRRVVSLYTRGEGGARPSDAALGAWASDPRFAEHPLFYEYFHGDSGAGLGASHQTGWTALLAKLVQQSVHWKRGPRG